MMKKMIWTAQENLSFEFDGGCARLSASKDGTQSLRIDLPYKAAFGGGERFNTVNLAGHRITLKVEEKFCEQFDKSYIPIPFFFTNSGFGFYANTGQVMDFLFQDDFVLINLPLGTEIFLFSGSPQKILADYLSCFSAAILPPDYAFLPWISANHWDNQALTEKQLDRLKENDFPAGVIVLEAWSDEATFYIFNRAKYEPNSDGIFSYEDFSFEKDGPWPDPKAMIEKFHAAGLKVVLWQIPVYKLQAEDEVLNPQNELDRKKALENKLCVALPDGQAYEIPEGHWFAGSMIPDFSNPKTVKDWFGKRQYLLDIGIDGFKTDGGEFIYRDDLISYNGKNGKELCNLYPQSYTSAYTDFLSESHVLFSRAGYAGAQTTPIHWAGDQQSTFSEMRSQLKAGLSAAMSGLIFWSYDIGGFAGPLPSADLYLRSTQMATFCPIMQWHSEPAGGQFRDLMTVEDRDNERSPWNIAKRSGDAKLLERTRFYHKLRVKLQDYIKAEAKQAVAASRPMMRPLAFDNISDENTYNIVDEYMFGSSLLIAPIMTEKTTSRQLYLPKGIWESYWTGEQFAGGQTINFEHEWHIPVYKKID
jgi:alpha-D-xyloside xylohydrolase